MSGLPIVRFTDGYPSCNLHNLRSIVGNSASERLLFECFSSKDTKLHWVVNSYFRATFQTDNFSDYRLRNDFKTSPLVIAIALSALPIELLVKVLSYADCTSLVRFTSANKFYRSELLTSPTKFQCALWVSLLKSYRYAVDSRNASSASLVNAGAWLGGQRPTPSFRFRDIEHYCIFDTECLEQNEVNYFALFKKCFVAEWNFCCVRCNESDGRPASDKCAIIPILYGYPSALLIHLHNSGSIALGGDYLLEGASNWRCRSCKAEFYSYPYRCGWMEMD